MTTNSVSSPKIDRRGTNPKSLANLKPAWKPGQSGKPGGNPYPISRHLKDLLCNEKNGKEVAETILRTATLPNSRGYSTALTQLLDRTEGKVPGDDVQVNFNTIEVLIVEAPPPTTIIISEAT